MNATQFDTSSVSGAFLAEIAGVGRNPEGGWSRLGFTTAEREAHAIFRHWADRLGLEVTTDAIGNTIAELPGRRAGGAIVTGSHLDSVPGGGTFDGAAGVAAGLEAVSMLIERGDTLLRPVRVVAFACEEGAVYGAPCIGSRCVTGAFGATDLQAFVDEHGVSVWDRARACGLHPEMLAEDVWTPEDVGAFLELHIEQGRVLAEREIPIGVVHSIAGSTRVLLRLQGRADHSGATPMWLRSDALAGAAEIVLAVERRARLRSTSVATVGRLQVRPGALTTIPGEAELTIDSRDLDSDAQRELVEDVLNEAMAIARRRGLDLEAELLSDQSPVLLHDAVQERLTAAAVTCSTPFLVMPSGASHDAAHLAELAPTGMLFVPSRDGVSHSPEEWSDTQEISVGARVLGTAIADLADRDDV